jgi:ribonuclease P/MRP protein subunit POP5
MVWAALTCMTKLPKPVNTPVVVRVIHVSGTIKKAEEEVIRRAKQTMLKVKLAEAERAEGKSMDEIMKAVERSVAKESKSMVVEIDDGEEDEGGSGED